jgi:hypothetical protein
VRSLEVKTWGERINSPRPERRYLYYELLIDNNRVEPNNIDHNIIDIIRREIRREEVEMPGEKPWFLIRQCEYCYKRAQYVINKVKNGEYVWRRMYCLRHYFLLHLDFIDLAYSNKEQHIKYSFTDKTIYAKIQTNNYKYDIFINTNKAIANINYKGKQYVFTYSNHINAFPLSSSYQYLLKITNKITRLILDDIIIFLDEIKRKGCYHDANIAINSVEYPVCPENHSTSNSGDQQHMIS